MSGPLVIYQNPNKKFPNVFIMFVAPGYVIESCIFGGASLAAVLLSAYQIFYIQRLPFNAKKVQTVQKVLPRCTLINAVIAVVLCVDHRGVYHIYNGIIVISLVILATFPAVFGASVWLKELNDAVSTYQRFGDGVLEKKNDIEMTQSISTSTRDMTSTTTEKSTILASSPKRSIWKSISLTTWSSSPRELSDSLVREESPGPSSCFRKCLKKLSHPLPKWIFQVCFVSYSVITLALYAFMIVTDKIYGGTFLMMMFAILGFSVGIDCLVLLEILKEEARKISQKKHQDSTRAKLREFELLKAKCTKTVVVAGILTIMESYGVSRFVNTTLTLSGEFQADPKSYSLNVDITVIAFVLGMLGVQALYNSWLPSHQT
jgi:hypothetical protein